MQKAKARVARRSSDKRWQVAKGGRPPALVCDSFAEALVLAGIVWMEPPGALEARIPGVGEMEGREIIQRARLVRDAQAHALELLDLGMGRRHIMQRAKVGKREFDMVLDGSLGASESVAVAVMGVDFELSDLEAAALDIEHFMQMGGTAEQAIAWWNKASGDTALPLSKALQMATMRRTAVA